jgi:hypothetical protein
VDVSGKLRRAAQPGIRPIGLLLEKFDEKIKDLIDRCVRWMPEDRIDAEAGLQHTCVRGGQKTNTM